jgi:hypothetical protein
VILCFWIGIYPMPFLDFLHQPAARIANVIQPDRFTTPQSIPLLTAAPTQPPPAATGDAEAQASASH